jgi:hypothetical protein
MGRSRLEKLVRADIHGSDEHRNGVLRNLDVHMVRNGAMREAIIIGFFLLTAVLVWTIPRKGGKR